MLNEYLPWLTNAVRQLSEIPSIMYEGNGGFVPLPPMALQVPDVAVFPPLAAFVATLEVTEFMASPCAAARFAIVTLPGADGAPIWYVPVCITDVETHALGAEGIATLQAHRVAWGMLSLAHQYAEGKKDAWACV